MIELGEIEQEWVMSQEKHNEPEKEYDKEVILQKLQELSKKTPISDSKSLKILRKRILSAEWEAEVQMDAESVRRTITSGVKA